jgi:hypothetical protein
MKRRRCELILPASEYDGMPLVADENDGHKYHKGEKGRYLKLSRKTCNMCNKPSLFVGIFTYRRHKRVERFCREHAQQFTNGPLPPIPEKEKIESKPRKPIII